MSRRTTKQNGDVLTEYHNTFTCKTPNKQVGRRADGRTYSNGFKIQFVYGPFALFTSNNIGNSWEPASLTTYATHSTTSTN